MRRTFGTAQRPAWLLAVALSGLPLADCYAEELGAAQGSFGFARAEEAEDLGDELVPLALAESAGVPRSLCSAGDMMGVENTGWRMGVFSLSGRSTEDMLDQEILENKTLSAWGYQWQWQYGEPGTTQGLVDVVPLVMGLDESTLIPSVSVLVGLRLGGHWEFGLGPHYSPRAPDLDPFPDDNIHISGLGLAFAAGYADVTENGVNWSINFSGMKAGDLAAYGITAGWSFSSM